ncbi:MAG TPA: FCD domain-containing protein [Acidimicrobiales bacterium]|nr:FCD domain-containing protein [Acidimicrobiales bacterium]
MPGPGGPVGGGARDRGGPYGAREPGGRPSGRARQPGDILELQQMPARMRSAVDEGELVVYEQLNGVLHRAVQRISANATCTRTLDRLRAQIARHHLLG